MEMTIYHVQGGEQSSASALSAWARRATNMLNRFSDACVPARIWAHYALFERIRAPTWEEDSILQGHWALISRTKIGPGRYRGAEHLSCLVDGNLNDT
jgi:hypothetical protein